MKGLGILRPQAILDVLEPHSRAEIDDQPTGTDKADVADPIAADCPLRVVARAQGGVLVKTGADSLLVFAVAPGADVATTLRRLRWREQLGIMLAGAGATGLLVQLVRALVRVAQG